ncbi:LysR family transcriptional regulator [Novosphingobium terrae]|uniref:LysR family transcriptional regulator n=1 Tax=Novosphingobium terrae TaxID=2726189 RepID=UPI001F12B0CB|nr:LysR family transcriptional regulator [Novosphingobium terrae]
MNKIIDWEDQRAFLAVLEAGSLSAAARAMGVAQPTMRARIEALEQALGVVLFTRSVRGLVPTEQARALKDSAAAMARASEAFVRAASAPPGEVAGAVRLSVSDMVGIEVLPAMLASLREKHPGLILEIVTSNASANLLDQEVDLAVRMHPPKQAALVARKVPAIPLGLFAHRDYLARRGMPRTLADLNTHDIIGPDRSLADQTYMAQLFPDLPHDRVTIRTDSHPAQLAAARAGLGIAVMQTPLGQRDPALRAVLPDLSIAPLETWIVTHEDLRHVPRVRAVFDHLVACFDAYGS